MIALLSIFAVAKAATATFNVTVPNDGGTDNHHQTNKVMIVGNFNDWKADKAVECTKISNTKYTVTLDESTFVGGTTLATLSYKYVCGPDWAYVMKNEDGTELAANLAYAGTTPQEDVVVYWASVWKDVTPIPGVVTIEIYAPKSVIECYITGNFNDWKSPGFVGKKDSTDTKMTYDAANSDANGNFYTTKIYTKNTYALAYKFAAGPSWTYQQNEGNLGLADPTQLTALHDNITFSRVYPGVAGLKNVTLNVTVPTGTQNVYLMGSHLGWDGTSWAAGTKNTDGTFTIVVPNQDIFEYKYFNGTDWAAGELKADGTGMGNRTADAQIKTTFDDVIVDWAVKSGMDQLDADKYKVYSSNKSIVVEGVTSKAELFDISGRNIESKVMSGTFRSTVLNAGLYIVKIDGQTQKVSVK